MQSPSWPHVLSPVAVSRSGMNRYFGGAGFALQLLLLVCVLLIVYHTSLAWWLNPIWLFKQFAQYSGLDWGWGGMLYEPFSQNCAQHHAYVVSFRMPMLPRLQFPCSSTPPPSRARIQHDHGATRIPRNNSTRRSGCR